MTKCREVARLVASEELADIAWLKRAVVRFHLFMCRDCRSYEVQLRAIGTAARDRSEWEVSDMANFEKLQSSLLDLCREASDEDIEDEPDRDPQPPLNRTPPQ